MNLLKTKKRIHQEELVNKFVDEHTYPAEVNIFPKPCDAQKALNFLQDLILGEDWYCADPLPQAQVNTIIATEIAKRYVTK